MFYDLNVPFAAVTGPAAGQEKLELRKRIELLVHLGYQAIAYNIEVTGKLANDHVNPVANFDFSLSRLKQYSRLTLVLEDTSQNYGLSGNNPQVLSYDILAVQPTTEKMFQSACSTLDVDIISIDMSSKIPFYLKHTTVGQAVERGIFFEICYSAALKDASARRNLIMNAKSLIRVTRGRNLIITSQARKAMELRGPYDMVNFATLLGIGQSAAKDCLSTNCRAVLFHAETRRNTTKAVFSAEPSENLQDTEQWKLGNKRKKINLKKARATDKRPRVETDTAAEAETGS